MSQDYQVARLPELLKSLTLRMPVRRSQITSWGTKLLGMNKPFLGRFMGHPIEVRPLEAASRSAYFLGFYERETTAWALNYFRQERPQVIVDVGAHFGYFIYLALAELSNCSIFAFEPDPYNRAWLETNLDMIQSSNTIHIEPVAISNQPGKVKFLGSDPKKYDNLWAGINLKDQTSDFEIEVPSITMDAFCAERNLESVDLIIIDIEGAEGFAVEGMSNGIKKRIYKNILLEFHPEFLSGDYSSDKIIAKFLDAGYKAYHFQSPYKNNHSSDKTPGFYDLSWKESYLKEIHSNTIQLEGWEHILFKR